MLKILMIFFLIMPFYSFCDLEFNPKNIKHPLTTLYKNRTKQYSMSGYRQFVMQSYPRTGSTLVFNILKYLFEDVDKMHVSPSILNIKKKKSNKILKTHRNIKLKNPNTLYFCSIRHPVDAIYSMFRTTKIKPSKNLKNSIEEYIDSLNLIESLLEENRVVVLKYENFTKDMDYIFHVIEEHLSIEIDDIDKKILYEELRVDKVKKYTKNLRSFGEYDQVTQYHGEHIDQTPADNRKKMELKSKITNGLIPYKEKLEKWGYHLDL